MQPSSYKYKLKMSYTLDDKEIIIDEKHILSVIVDHDYESKNMPIMLMKVALDKKIVDDMVLNVNKKWVVITINKYIENAKPLIERTIVKDRFIYFLPSTELNKTDELDYSDKDKDIVKTVTIGLMQLDALNNNKVMVNNVYKNVSTFNIIYNCLSNRPLLIEPFNNNTYHKELIVVPCSTTNEFIKFLNSQSPPYNSKYRLYYDYSKTYFMSSLGKGLPSKDEEYNTVIINVTDVISSNSKMQGIITDQDSKSYIMDIGLKELDFVEDKVSSVSANKQITISSTGDKVESSINTFDNKDTLFSNTSRVTINRVNSTDLTHGDNMVKDVEDSSVRLNIIRNDIDTSIFTINKEYHVKNTDKTANKDGRYILVNKKEAYSRKEGTFMLTTILMFKKIMS